VSSWRRSGQPCSFSCLGINVIDHGGIVNLNNTHREMEFIEAMERLKRAVTDDEIAAAVGVSANTIRRARADPSTRNYRPPPRGWEAVIGRLAAKRAEELLSLQHELMRKL
jgi:hypothetical protein